MLKLNNIKLLNVNKKFICPECNYIYESNAYQAECGCIVCNDCLDKTRIENKCKLCDDIITIPYIQILDKSLLRELNNTSFECPECNLIIKNINCLKEHIINNHANKLNCEYCNNNANNNDTIIKLENKIKILENNLNKLNNDFLNHILLYEKQNKLLNELHSKYDESFKKLDNNLQKFQALVINYETKLTSLEFRSTNGNIIWKITNVSQKIIDAKSNRQKSIYSPIFYTDNYGYRMCARVYLNGDGIGLNNSLSIFISLLKGEYDDLLTWPFNNKINIIVIDQSNKKNNICDSFKPDPQSNSFQKPITDINIASGIPKFCSLDLLLSTEFEYIKNDCLYIQIIVG